MSWINAPCLNFDISRALGLAIGYLIHIIDKSKVAYTIDDYFEEISCRYEW